MNRQQLHVGIIGAGDFGTVLQRLFADVAEIVVADQRELEQDNQVTLAELAARSNVIFLAIPFEAYEAVLPELAQHANATSLIVDISSVKVRPKEMLAELMPQHEHLLLHPLFGPQSAPGTDLNNLSLVVCSEPTNKAQVVIDRFLALGARRVDMSPEEHDESMAYTQALTFFLGRGLTDMKIEHTEFATPSYDKLMSLRALDRQHSQDLFETIQKANPYAAEVRQKMIETLQTINRRLDQE